MQHHATACNVLANSSRCPLPAARRRRFKKQTHQTRRIRIPTSKIGVHLAARSNSRNQTQSRPLFAILDPPPRALPNEPTLPKIVF
jgi:hypothetical protein